ncbi:hypothetical protein [Mycobacterium sp.]|uniref:hypothetical protein n=1 Tax=Mycobacterium sp. TaxID=1785 RepID=UPI002BD4613E|nr:hypothetical protein [Mycobacterium sp.]HME48979.1 hypothetical protein [Mycobacterium sp.]
MGQLKHVATPMAAAAMLAAGSGIAAADGPTGVSAERATVVPMSQVLRRCDFTDDTYVPSSGSGSAVSIISSTGSNVTAEVQLTRAKPGVRYFVRLVETPPPTDRCRPGNPGVAAGTIDTDGAGTGSVTLSEAVLSGTTGAGVFIEGPPADFYSSDFLAPI